MVQMKRILVVTLPILIATGCARTPRSKTVEIEAFGGRQEMAKAFAVSQVMETEDGPVRSARLVSQSGHSSGVPVLRDVAGAEKNQERYRFEIQGEQVTYVAEVELSRAGGNSWKISDHGVTLKAEYTNPLRMDQNVDRRIND